ncbi:MAG: type II secretion system protein [Desulfobacterales bacterium]|uniref:Type II secretion system protein n=1 Tax=Candidatus Desulfatibia vada TaxID=2841696 RepID=A0A8J6TUV6_9BACT|nr:type II secretion system protein [Candidatus Desulfatibia vada]
MKMFTEEGLTLVELLMAIAIFGLIATGATTLLSASLGAQAQGEANYKLYQEGLIIMERLTSEVKTTTLLHIPNNHTPIRTILAFSANINEDGDSYFGDALFPRIDEDSDNLLFFNGYGIPGLDDDGDGTVDEIGSGKNDDDEDGVVDEEILDGLDDDGDGDIDEDLTNDSNGDASPGISGMDDDGDLAVDEGNYQDDDEDGTMNEDPPNLILYSFDAPNTTLYKVTPDSDDGMTSAVYATISNRVTFFQTTYLDPDKILIELTLTNADGKTAVFSEYVSPRNRYQKTGKRVR